MKKNFALCCGFAFLASCIGDKAAKKLRKWYLRIDGGLLLGRAQYVRACCLALTLHSSVCGAANQPDAQFYDIDIPKLNVAEAINRLAKHTGATLLFPYDLAKSRQANPVVGRFTLIEALNRLLQGSGFSGGLSDKGVIKISLAETETRNNEGKAMISKANKSKPKISFFARIAATLLAVVSPVTVSGQEAMEEGASVIEEVVVRARKRGALETVQNTPIAMTVFTGANFEGIFAENLTDLGRLAPNVDLRAPGSVRNVQNFMIRGMGLTGSTPSDDPAVGIVQDDVYWGVNYGGLLTTFDIESIEILRGPQGTLFGRNVTGGAIAVRSARPSGEFNAKGSVIAGNDGLIDLQVSVEGPLTSTIAGRLAIKKITSDGDLRNLETGNDNGEKDATIIRSIVKWEPSENSDVTLIYENYSDDGDSARTFAQADPSKLSVSIFGFTKPRDFFSFRGSEESERSDDVSIDSVTLDANWNLGYGIMTLILNRRFVESFNTLDTAATQFGLLDSPLFGMDQDQFSTEIRYASTLWEDFEFVVGAYYFEQDYVHRQLRNVLFAFPAGTPGRAELAFEVQLDHQTAALFGEVEYHLSDKWRIAFGARWTKEEKDAKAAPWGQCALDFSSCVFVSEGDDTWTNISPSATISYTPHENLLAYASFDRGFRSGGFSLRGTTFTGPFDEETVNALEIGIKLDLADGDLRFNVAAFYNDYDDLQRTVLRDDPDSPAFIQSTFNAARATIKGVEIEITARPWVGAQLNVTYGFTDASYDKFEGLDVNGDGIPDPELAKDKDFLRVPENTVSVVGTQEFAVADLGSLLARLQYSFTDSQYFDEPNTNPQDSYHEVDVSLTFNPPNRNWSVSIFAKNVFEEEYYLWGAEVGSLSRVGASVRPRTYGIRFTADL